MALTQVKAAGLTADLIDETKLADDSIDSEHYNDGSIDHEHLADDCVDGDNIADNSVGLAHMAGGTDGQIITYDASGDPVAVGPGIDGQVLTSTGAGSPPAFEALPASGVTVSNNVNNRVVTGDGSNLNAEAGLTCDGTHLSITDGDLVIATSGHGIDFSANTSTSTTDAAMTSELLDWYEEGTFTPKITFGNTTNFVGGSYDTCNGVYTRVGRLVTISFTTAISAKGSSSGLVHINGLPFSSGGSTHRGGGRTSYCTIFSTETDNTACQLYLGDSRTYLQCVHDSLDNLNASDCNSTGAINTTMQYQVP